MDYMTAFEVLQIVWIGVSFVGLIVVVLLLMGVRGGGGSSLPLPKYIIPPPPRSKEVKNTNLGGIQPKLPVEGVSKPKQMKPSAQTSLHESGSSTSLPISVTSPTYTIPAPPPTLKETVNTQYVEYVTANELNFLEGNVIKYVTRASSKGNRLEDLNKAKFCLEREIKRVKDSAEELS